MITPCPSPGKEGCPYALTSRGCFADTDHILPRFLAKGARPLIKNYIRSEANKQQLCRFEHEQKTIEDWHCPPPIPDEQFMINAIRAARRG